MFSWPCGREFNHKTAWITYEKLCSTAVFADFTSLEMARRHTTMMRVSPPRAVHLFNRLSKSLIFKWHATKRTSCNKLCYMRIARAGSSRTELERRSASRRGLHAGRCYTLTVVRRSARQRRCTSRSRSSAVRAEGLLTIDGCASICARSFVSRTAVLRMTISRQAMTGYEDFPAGMWNFFFPQRK